MIDDDDDDDDWIEVLDDEWTVGRMIERMMMMNHWMNMTSSFQ